MLTATVVSSAAHGVLASFVAVSLRRGAKTEARRRLGAVFGWFFAHSVAIGCGYAASRPWKAPLFELSVLFALVCVLNLARFASSTSSGWSRAWLRAGKLLTVAALVAGVALAGVVIWLAMLGLPYARFFAASSGLVFVAFIGAFAGFVRAVRQGVAGAGKYLWACALPLLPLAMNIASNLGLQIEGYRVVKDISLLFFLFGVLAAYLDSAEEPMSLRARLLAGALTCVLATVILASQFVIPYAADEIRSDASTAEVERVAAPMLAVCIAASAGVLFAFPLLFRRNLFMPLDDLLRGVRALQAGTPAHVPVRSKDELGALAGAFNAMTGALDSHRRSLEARISELQEKNDEIAGLNEDLRRQVAARSRELRSVLGDETSSSFVLAPGDVVDLYRVERTLGAGGMGVVYEVLRTRDGRSFALKMILGANRGDAARFAREAEIAGSVAHPNIVSMVDVGVWRHLPYFVMELVRGGSLEAARDKFGDVPWALARIREIADALAELHRRGIVHRDLKPLNVLLNSAEDPTARVADFGIARYEVDTLGATVQTDTRDLTESGVMLGTLAYMAPEMAQGGRKVGPEGDIFALGLVARELLGGLPAFPTPPVLEAMARRPLPSPAPLPSSVADSVRRMLDSCVDANPSARPTAREVALSVNAALSRAAAPTCSPPTPSQDAGR